MQDVAPKGTLSVEPVLRSVARAILSSCFGATVAVTTGRQDSVHELGVADAAVLCAKLEPSYGAGPVAALVGAGGGIDPSVLSGEHVDLAALKNEVGDAGAGEEVVAEEGQLPHTPEAERSILGEWVGLRSAGVLGVNSPSGGLVEVEGNILSPKSAGGETIPVLL